MNRLEMKPSKILITSSGNQQSVLWMGTFGQLEVKKVIMLDVDKLYFTTSVVIKNVGSAALRDFYCKSRTLVVVDFVAICTDHCFLRRDLCLQMRGRWIQIKSSVSTTPLPH